MKLRILCLLVAAAFVVAACGGSDGGAAGDTAAVVAGRTVTVEEVSTALDRFRETAQFDQLVQESSANEAAHRFEQGYLSQIIRRHVLLDAAQSRDVTASSEEIDRRLDEIRSQFQNEEAFQQAVDQQGLTSSQLNDLVRDQVLEDRLRQDVTSDIAPDEAELRQYYEENVDDFRETRTSHILFGQNEKQVAERTARQLQNAKPNQLEVRFEVAARQYSQDPGSQAKGGDLGFQRAGQFVPEYEQAAADLEVGEVSDPVASQFGFHVIMVTGRRTGTFEQARSAIAQQLGGSEQEGAFQDFIVGAYRNADISVNPRFGELDIETQQVVNPTAEDIPGAEDSGESGDSEGGGATPAPEESPQQ